MAEGQPKAPFTVAIVGGGLVGLLLALTLDRRGIRVRVYEQSRDFRHIGAGISFGAVTRECLHLLGPDLVDGLKTIAGPMMRAFESPSDGYHETDATRADPELEVDWIHTGCGTQMGFWPCHRADFMGILYGKLPEGVFQPRKRFEKYSEDAETGKMKLHFADGAVEEADAVIGCDGIKSKTRQIVFGKDNPISYPHYIHKFMYRATVPMDRVIAAVGERVAMTVKQMSGQDGHMVRYPIANASLLNIAVYCSDPNPWPDAEKLAIPASPDEVREAYKDFNSLTRRIIDTCSENIDRYAVFDMSEHPAPYFNKGRVCLVGDAAHAASPNLGSGAGFGVEDVLVMVTVLQGIDKHLRAQPARDQQEVNRAIEAAFEVFNEVRYTRDVTLVQYSRECGEILDWMGPDGDDSAKCEAAMEKRQRFLFEFDVAEMLAQTKSGLGRRLVV